MMFCQKEEMNHVLGNHKGARDHFVSIFLLLGCRMAIPVGKWVDFSVLFSVSVKVLPVTPLVSGVFVHRAFCTYFLRIERVVEMRRFLWWTQ